MDSAPDLTRGRSLFSPASVERGFSLIEVMVAAVVAVIAVIGLAYSFSAGRGLMDRFAAARDALEGVQSRLDRLAMQAARDPAAADLNVGTHGPFARILNHNLSGHETWTVVWVDDPVDNTGSGDPDPHDYKRATVVIDWQQAALHDHVQMSRSFLGP